MVSFRAASPAEPDAHALLEQYFALRAEAFPGSYTTVFPSPATFEPPAGVFVVASADPEDGLALVGPVGCGGIRRLDDGPHGARYEVKHLFLAPATRGRGWGSLLLADLERRAIAFGAVELVLDTHHTLVAAAGLYASAGFAEIEPYNDNPNATRWYGKDLVG